MTDSELKCFICHGKDEECIYCACLHLVNLIAEEELSDEDAGMENTDKARIVCE